MASETILDWNIPNWITVVLMALIMFAILGLIQKGIQKRVSSNANNQQ